ncbi:unnamed protein product, partial [Ixodes pacificus]
ILSGICAKHKNCCIAPSTSVVRGFPSRLLRIQGSCRGGLQKVSLGGPLTTSSLGVARLTRHKRSEQNRETSKSWGGGCKLLFGAINKTQTTLNLSESKAVQLYVR